MRPGFRPEVPFQNFPGVPSQDSARWYLFQNFSLGSLFAGSWPEVPFSTKLLIVLYDGWVGFVKRQRQWIVYPFSLSYAKPATRRIAPHLKPPHRHRLPHAPTPQSDQANATTDPRTRFPSSFRLAGRPGSSCPLRSSLPACTIRSCASPRCLRDRSRKPPVQPSAVASVEISLHDGTPNPLAPPTAEFVCAPPAVSPASPRRSTRAASKATNSCGDERRTKESNGFPTLPRHTISPSKNCVADGQGTGIWLHRLFRSTFVPTCSLTP